MAYISVRICGLPYGGAGRRQRGKIHGPDEWTQAVVEQTRDLPRVSGPCTLRVTFLLPPDRFPGDYPYGPDLDNYLKRFQDALHRTIFADVPGGDSCVVSLEVSKTRIASSDLAGAQLEVIPHGGWSD